MPRLIDLPSRPDLRFERRLQRQGLSAIAGLDEVGRGAWAGPVTAAAVVLPLAAPRLARQLEGVRDSKQMTARQRNFWAGELKQLAQAYGLGHASAAEVDRLGLIGATRLAMGRALEAMPCAPQHLLIDHIALPDIHLPQTSITHGDALVLSIAAASVLAKVERDRLMAAFDSRWPGYEFGHHKGYGTAAHRRALLGLGPSPIHRMSYAPLAELGRKPGDESPRHATATL
jgi:ribonuclease HII